MTYRQFAERLNKELDSIDLPSLHQDRVNAFAKLLHIQKFQAETLLTGSFLPKGDLLNKLAEELDVNPDWLLGNSDQRQRKHNQP
jgi:hypothetical protein